MFNFNSLQVVTEQAGITQGSMNGFPYVIRDMEFYYCAYVGIPKNHPLYGITEDTCDLPIHGGITYTKKSEDFWVIGWDYMHVYDENVTIEDIKEDIEEITLRLGRYLQISE